MTNIKALCYDPCGELKVKLDFDNDFKSLQSRPKQIAVTSNNPSLYSDRLEITQTKWKHLQYLKSVISKDCHTFYDLLPYKKDKTAENTTESDALDGKQKTKKCKK
ncbi:unnamed protein product [Acanthoscelides obtectus]|uniref:Uncharacterized protein n=1 Tax=Acanthoscelides obtectus TaxID=200917 RepID=A0A9P0P4U7_ACAOB|nr:unnamed protein product [Acanthoscelides obtectus]CAK1643765.1 hypothetical protein AOBTE_LOCUS13667 [Acanthoscelides obtectus]